MYNKYKNKEKQLKKSNFIERLSEHKMLLLEV